MKLGVAIGVLVAGCGSPPCYPTSARYNVTGYARSPGRSSPGYGFAVDDPGAELDLQSVDHTVANVIECVQEVWPTMTPEERQRARCTGTPAIEARSCLVVQVPPDWYVSPVTGNQIFPCDVGDAPCLAKGQVPTAANPCSCRAIIQDQSRVLTAPNLELFPARLTELLTGCDDIWQTPLKACGHPTMVRP